MGRLNNGQVISFTFGAIDRLRISRVFVHTLHVYFLPLLTRSAKNNTLKQDFFFLFFSFRESREEKVLFGREEELVLYYQAETRGQYLSCSPLVVGSLARSNGKNEKTERDGVG